MRSAIWARLYKTDAIRTPRRMGTQGGHGIQKGRRHKADGLAIQWSG